MNNNNNNNNNNDNDNDNGARIVTDRHPPAQAYMYIA